MSTHTPLLREKMAPEPEAELRLPGMLIGAAAIVAAAVGLALLLAHFAGAFAGASPAVPQEALRPEGPAAWLAWMLGDITSAQFYKSPLASLGLLVGALIAWSASRRRSPFAGTPIAYGSGLWPWMLGAAALSLVISNALLGWRIDADWSATFIPFVCVAATVVLVYGPGLETLVTGAVLGALTTTPISIPLMVLVTTPLGLPSVVAATLAMAIGGALTFAVIRRLPWMRPRAVTVPPGPVRIVEPRPSISRDAVWTVRRVVCDFTEAQFWATEIATLGLIAGLSIGVLFGPAEFAGLLPQVIVAQALTSAIGVVLWRRGYRGGGYVPTFIPVVSVAPAVVLAYGGSVPAIILGAVAGALLGPLLAKPIARRLPVDFHPVIANTAAMAVATAIVVPLVGLVLRGL